MNESDDPKSEAGTNEKPVTAEFKKPRMALIIVSGVSLGVAILAAVLSLVLRYSLDWDDWRLLSGLMSCAALILALAVSAFFVIEPTFKGGKYRIVAFLLSAISVALCATSMGIAFDGYVTPVWIMLFINVGFSFFLLASLILPIVFPKLRFRPRTSKNDIQNVRDDASSLFVKTQDASPVHSKDRAVLLTATYNKGIGLWTSICQGFANIFGCKCKHYDKKVSIALSEIKKSLLWKMSSYPDYDFGAFHIASDGRLSFTGSVIGVKKVD